MSFPMYAEVKGTVVESNVSDRALETVSSTAPITIGSPRKRVPLRSSVVVSDVAPLVTETYPGRTIPASLNHAKSLRPRIHVFSEQSNPPYPR
eukprot:snap_masked-scaffold_1-processed-gene-31.29-mRNA-1 protein AED:1.00 eAED:1.00 QI:0/-1/0/0/-1/1/1/0/92